MQARTHRLAVLLVHVALGTASILPAQERLLADHGRSDYVIVVAAGAPQSTRYAAEELQHCLAEMTGATLPIVADASPLPEHALLVGSSPACRELGLAEPIAKLGPESYLLRTLGDRLVVAGGEPRGTLYGVFGLCEEHFGCRWFTPEVHHLPKSEKLALPTLDETRSPALEYRDLLIYECHDGDWAARNRVNSTHARLEARHGGKVEYFGFVHTFAELLPPAQYFARHPEYYSEIGGVRIAAHAQLCCTNADVLRLVTEEVVRRMRAHPEATIFSVSQNDCFNFCCCARCTELATREGSQAAPVLQLVNHVAEAVAKEFPGKLVDTLAYQWTRHPPKTLRPRPNVIVRLCSIECCFTHAFDRCDGKANRAFVADLQGWSKVCDRLWMWDYTTDFANYLLPLPNLDVLAANIRVLAQNHVTGIFEEGDYSSPHGEFQMLRGYVLAKCLWDPRTDGKQARDEFLDGVYGAAAPPIRQYLDALQVTAAKTAHVGIYQGVDAPWLDASWQAQADRLWDDAEKLAGTDAPLLARVRAARLSVDYAVIERARLAKQPATDELRLRVERFLATAKVCGLSALREGGGDLAAYARDLHAALHL